MDKNIILFGGTFDPVHLGHTKVAMHAADYLHAQRVLFVPARQSPHKHRQPLATALHRLAMLKAATGDDPRCEVCDIELNRPGVSYTIETVVELRESLGDKVELHLLIGTDAVSMLPKWYRVDELLRLCRVRIMVRGGVEWVDADSLAGQLPQEQIRQLKADTIPTPEIPISSTQVRRMAAEGSDISELVHPAVREYIERHELYRKSCQ